MTETILDVAAEELLVVFDRLGAMPAAALLPAPGGPAALKKALAGMMRDATMRSRREIPGRDAASFCGLAPGSDGHPWNLVPD